MQWVLSRPLYRFRRFDLKNVPKAQLAQALHLQIRQWSPYLKTGQYIAWGSDHALVWAWDADSAETDLVEQKLNPKSARIIPESLLHPPLSSGLRLLACLDGVEGEFWQEQRLVHSRWWPEQPSPVDWLNFQRDAGITPDQGLSAQLPALQTVDWLKQPWAKSANAQPGDNPALRHENWFIGCATLLLAAFTTWNGIELIKTRQAMDQLKITLDEASRNAHPLLEARRQALDAQARIESLQAVSPYPTQLALLAEVAKQMPNDNVFLKEWDYQNGRLKMTVASTGNLSSSFVVKKIQEITWFKNVQATPGNNPGVLTLSMDILSRSEVRPLAKAAENQAAAEKSDAPDQAAQLNPKT